MRAEVVQKEQGYTATFERNMPDSPGSVWAMLTDNSKLKQWFPELEVEELQKGGNVLFDMGDGSFEKIEILEFQRGQLLAYEWDEGTVRFDVKAADNGSTLRMVESFPRITPQTARDLAGWHICFDVIEAILEGRQLDRKQEWDKEHEEYKRLLESLSTNFE